ncbi:MAG: hypothetical protein L6R37_008130 [Teloschistes peruensis]|nr:MAG: hypothetical protein L6R37_008130 [Teloschistes peruensis]
MNEPDSSFQPCTQEGMSVPTSLRPVLLTALCSALTAATTANATALKNIKILGDETSQIASQAILEYTIWLPPTLQSNSLDAIAIHNYDFPDDITLLNYRALLTNLSSPSQPPPIKMTETSTFRAALGIYQPWGWTGPNIFGREYDPGIATALDMVRQIWQSLTLLNAESWEWWTAVSNMMPCSPSRSPPPPPAVPSAAANCAYRYDNISDAYNDGLVYIDPRYNETKDYGFYLPKRYHVFRHFSRFIRSGAVRYDIPNEILPYGTVAVAAENTDGVFTVVFINRNGTEQNVKMEVPRAGMRVVGAVMTTQEENWGEVSVEAVGADGSLGIVLPAHGVLSVRFAAGGAGGGKAGVGSGGGPRTRKNKRKNTVSGLHGDTEPKGKRPWHWVSRP